MIDRLMEEATQHLEQLQEVLAAQWGAREGRRPTAQHALDIQEYNISQATHVAWEKAHQALTAARNAFEQIERLERESETPARGADA
jgi:hypothetical protein